MIIFYASRTPPAARWWKGIARSLVPAGTQVWSAGSRPTRVRPEAILVLREIGIDISGHRSKAVSEIPAAEVDTVITLW
jgi:arsenate reductase